MHFVKDHCSEDTCDLEFRSQKVNCSKLKIIKKLATVDLAILRCREKKFPQGFKFERDFNLGLKKGKVTIYLTDSNLNVIQKKGKIKWNSKLMYVISTRLTFGSSGSPVFDENGKLVGVVVRAETPQQGLLGKIFPGYKFSIKAVKSKYIKSIMKGNPRMPEMIKNDLLNHYRAYIRNKTKFDRFLESLEFTKLVNSFAYDFPQTSDVLTVREGPFWQKIPKVNSRFFPLIMAYHLEKYGSFDVNPNVLDSNSLELLKTFNSTRYFGQQAFFLGSFILGLLILFLTVFVAVVSSFASLQKIRNGG